MGRGEAHRGRDRTRGGSEEWLTFSSPIHRKTKRKLSSWQSCFHRQAYLSGSTSPVLAQQQAGRVRSAKPLLSAKHSSYYFLLPRSSRRMSPVKLLLHSNAIKRSFPLIS